MGSSQQQTQTSGGGEGSSGGVGLGADLMRLDDPSASFGRVQEQFRQGNLPFPVVSPEVYDFEPATVDTSDTQRLIQEQADRQAEALREIGEQADRRAEQARNRTLLNLAGPTAFQAISGANIDTGLDEQMQLQREAERRAAEIERQNRQQIPELQAQAELEATQLANETERQNQQAEQEAQARRAEALSGLASQTRQISSTLAEQRANIREAELENQGEGGAPQFEDMGPSDAVEFVRNNPGADEATVRSMANSTGLSTDFLLDQKEQAQMGGGVGNPIDVADRITSLEQQKSTIRSRAVNGTLTPDQQQRVREINDRQQELRSNLQQAASGQVTNIVNDLREGRISPGNPQRVQEGIRALNRAEQQGINTIMFEGERRDVGAVRDELQQAINPALERQEAEGRESRSMPTPQQEGGSTPSLSEVNSALQSIDLSGTGQATAREETETASRGEEPDTSPQAGAQRGSGANTQPASVGGGGGSASTASGTQGDTPGIVRRARNMSERLSSEAMQAADKVERLSQIESPASAIQRDLEEARATLESELSQAETAQALAQQRRRTEQRERNQRQARIQREIRQRRQRIRELENQLQQARQPDGTSLLSEEARQEIQAEIRNKRTQIEGIQQSPGDFIPDL